ncbi:PAS domain-containing sensor histidine kinase [Ktedonobacter robiniae]|uniref:histidine kinase n=1 Tax=Ktedonobacter robiniae TaxID=2778365 RepID=A0ABQ3V3L4_9CHLR|nr:PAS domain-containing sensor histidine kinase [Ktedonobacter robiniae]GHO59142.1 hypothetical protein KSB_76170 [Ktedonobacter robiniae]
MEEAIVRTALVTQKLEAFERLQSEFEASLGFIQDVHGQQRFSAFPVAETVHYLHALWICACKDHLLNVSTHSRRYEGNTCLGLLQGWQEGKTAAVVAFLERKLDGLAFAGLTRKIETAATVLPPHEDLAQRLAHGRLVLLNRRMNLLRALDAIFALSEHDLLQEVHAASVYYGHTPQQIEQQRAEQDDVRSSSVLHPLLAQRNMVVMNTIGTHVITQQVAGGRARFWRAVTPTDPSRPFAEYLMRTYQEQTSRSQNVQVQGDLLAQAHDAIIIHSPDDRILVWNQGATALYGWTEQEAIGKDIHTLLQTCFYASREAVALVLATRGHWQGQLTQTSHDGKRLIVESRQIFVPAKAGQAAVIVEMNQDVTEREQFLQEQAEAKARELALQETARQMDAFLGIASHELKTPLTSMKGNLQLAQLQLTHLQQPETTFDETMAQALTTVRSLLDRVERQIKRQNRLVNDLLDISRIQTNQFTLQRTRCDLVRIVCEVVEDQRILAPTRTIRWHTLVSQAEVWADADRVGQVVNNYLSNALKYSEAGTPIDVRLEQEETMVRVSVHNQGPGLSETQQQQVWKKFYRIGEMEAKSGSGMGLGLGLYISQTLIERHDGRIGVESTPGEGSTFWFTLPFAPLEHI